MTGDHFVKTNKEDIICIICARGGSKGLLKKNLQKLNDEPLIARPIKHAISSGVIGTTLVTTDDKEIARVAQSEGAVVPFLRPPTLAEDLTTTEDTLKHALLTYEKIVNRQFKVGVFITATDIFRNPKWINEAIEKLDNNPELESVFSGHKTHKNFWEQSGDGSWVRLRPWMATYSSRQVRRAIIREDTGLACASRTWLWREGRRIGDIVDVILNDDSFTSIDIHTKEDLLLAKAAMEIRKITND